MEQVANAMTTIRLDLQDQGGKRSTSACYSQPWKQGNESWPNLTVTAFENTRLFW